MSVFGFVVAGIITANIFGLRIFQITENKLTASDAGRKALSGLIEDIRNSKTSYVGNVASNGVFTALADGVAQSGGALLVYPTTNSDMFILYFLNPSDNTFRRTTSITNSTAILCRSITNTVLLRFEDFRGNILTNNPNNRVIYVDLESYQPARFGVVGDSYKVETAVTARTSH